MPGADFASAHSGLASSFSVSARSVFSGSAEAQPVQCCSLLCLAWDGILRIAFFFPFMSGNTAKKYSWEKRLKRRSLDGSSSAGMPLQNLLDAWHPMAPPFHLEGPGAGQAVIQPTPCLSFLFLVQPLEVPFQCIQCIISIPLLIV